MDRNSNDGSVILRSLSIAIVAVLTVSAIPLWAGGAEAVTQDPIPITIDRIRFNKKYYIRSNSTNIY